jgi:pyruvate dehydrogenase E1 component
MARNITEPAYTPEVQAVETEEWRESLNYVLQQGGPERVIALFEDLKKHAARLGVKEPFTANTPYVNGPAALPGQPSIGAAHQEHHPLERHGHGGARQQGGARHRRAHLHLRLRRHAVRGRLQPLLPRPAPTTSRATMVFFQGHASPGIYARAFLEGPAFPSETHLRTSAASCASGGLSSYPHPWLMPDFWQFPTVSMGLGPIMAIYQARFMRYLEDRGLKKPTRKVWAFLGDGETDEPERWARSRWPAARSWTT